jgi:hypothetical protein
MQPILVQSNHDLYPHVITPTCKSETSPLASIDDAAVVPYLALVPLFQVKLPHLDHPLLEVVKEHGLVHGITINNHPSLRRAVKGLV